LHCVKLRWPESSAFRCTIQDLFCQKYPVNRMTRVTAYLQQEVLQFAEALFPFYWTRRAPHSHPYANCNSPYHTHNSTVTL